MNKRTRTIVTIITLIMAFTATLNQTLMVTALPVLMTKLHVSLNTVQWLTTGYVLVLGIITPLSANLYQKFSNRKVFISVVLLFLLGSILGAVANSFTVILIARLLQATAGGILMSFMQIMLLEIYPSQERGKVMGLVSLVVSLAPAIGPSLGGLIVSALSWRYLFILTIPITMIIGILAIIFLPNVTTPRNIKIDIFSVLTSSVGLGALMYGISIITTNLILGMVFVILGLMVTAIFARRQFKLSFPMLNLKLLSQKTFLLMSVSALLVFGVLMGTETLMPLLVENTFHQTALIAGLVMLPGAFMLGILSPMIGNYYDQHGMKRPFIIGVILTLVSSVPFMFFNQDTAIWLLTVAYMVRLTGISFLMSTTITESLKGLESVNISFGTALNNALRQIGGSLFNTIMIVISGLTTVFVSGFHLAMGFTLIITLMIGLIGWIYLRES
ncbi:DHA2 family efflux MFS transporter permease subunit [Lactiplantibacillus garii]|uniref:DHA2 family efflux MFS transporter permease subunit n=1 Tax=Lactiplantibacillus garii TaxID=2306423 RepID=A0A3R8KDB6_9LACO|nr:DHA2 family efflux MFS transporter permease subunit [Lactiplantibacillus garii]RRK09670.1 DHA2 family efflux MFS transporter permease subunit [Lactiplantibacillus garii]